MKTNTKIVLGVAAVIVIAVALISSNTKLFRGSMDGSAIGLTPPAEFIPGVIHPVFAWVEPASTTLGTGNKVVVATFRLGASTSVSNPEAALAVSSLNFGSLGTAGLTNFTLRDITWNVNLASGASFSSFSEKVGGGSMSPLIFGPGETRMFAILAEVSTSIPEQTAQFRFYTGASATWRASDGTKSTLTELRSGDTSTNMVSAP